jgi:hypothetical protein
MEEELFLSGIEKEFYEYLFNQYNSESAEGKVS